MNITGIAGNYVNETVSFAGDDSRPITFIHALDYSTDGSGRFANAEPVGDIIGATSGALQWSSNITRYGVEFNVLVYAESSINANDFRFGVFQRGNELIHS